MSMPALNRRASLALTLGLAAALTGCSNHEAMKPYQPAAGVETNTPAVQVRNLMFISDGTDKGTLNGTIIALADDELTGLKGVALKADNSEADALTLNPVTIDLPKSKGINVEPHQITTSGLTEGGLTRLTLSFKKGGEVTLNVPVVDPKAHNLQPKS